MNTQTKPRFRSLLTAPLALIIACAPCPPKGTSDPSHPDPDHANAPRSAKSLCDMERGRYCETPAEGVDVQAPTEQTYEGWVCCAPEGEPCVAVSSFSECTFVGGWCYYYVENTDDTVTCYD